MHTTLTLQLHLTLTLVDILLRPHTLNPRRRTRIPPSPEIGRHLTDRIKPFVVLVQQELSLSDLRANGQPTVPDVVVSTEQLNPLAA
jgi:hypothetical protein